MWNTTCLPLRGVARKPLNLQLLPMACLAKRLGHSAKGHRPDRRLDLPCAALLPDLGLMFEPEIQGRQSGRGVPQGTGLGDTALKTSSPVHLRGNGRFQACVLGLLGLAGFLALDRLHHRRRAGVGLLLLDGQVAQHGVVELERMLQLSHHSLVGLDVDAQVVGLGELVDLVGQLATAPVFHAVHLAATGGDHALVALQHGGHLFALIRMDQQNDFVMTHWTPCGWGVAATRCVGSGVARKSLLL